jgi:cytochrome c oxidase subunit 2
VEIKLGEFKYIQYKYDSYIVPTDDLVPGTKRLLEVDKRLVLPTNVTLRFLITSSDVLHS